MEEIKKIELDFKLDKAEFKLLSTFNIEDTFDILKLKVSLIIHPKTSLFLMSEFLNTLAIIIQKRFLLKTNINLSTSSSSEIVQGRCTVILSF
jgi:hypothetical protein